MTLAHADVALHCDLARHLNFWFSAQHTLGQAVCHLTQLLRTCAMLLRKDSGLTWKAPIFLPTLRLPGLHLLGQRKPEVFVCIVLHIITLQWKYSYKARKFILCIEESYLANNWLCTDPEGDGLNTAKWLVIIYYSHSFIPSREWLVAPSSTWPTEA